MKRNRRRPAHMLAACAALLIMMLSPAHGQQRKPVTFDEILKLVQGGVPGPNILTAVQAQCLSTFRISNEMEAQLVSAGADASLVEGLRSICRVFPEGTVTDPMGRWVLLAEPIEWKEPNPQTLTVNANDPFRVVGRAHAPNGIDRIEINGQRASLANDPAGGTRFTATVNPGANTRGVELVLYPQGGGEPLRRMLPVSVVPVPVPAPAAAAPPRPEPTPTGLASLPTVEERRRAAEAAQPTYNPTAIAMSGIVPGMAQFKTGKKGLGIVVAGGAIGAIAAGILSKETTIRCSVDANPCPGNSVLSQETSKPMMVPGIAAGIGITALGAFLGYNTARSANARGGDDNNDDAGLFLSLLRTAPASTRDGGVRFELVRFRF